MKKYRIVLRTKGGKKHTRHVRATDLFDARKQLLVISAVLAPGEVTTADVTEMGNVNERRSR